MFKNIVKPDEKAVDLLTHAIYECGPDNCVQVLL